MFRWLYKKFLGEKQNVEKRQKYRYTLPPSLEGTVFLRLPTGERVSLKLVDVNDEAVAASFDAADLKLPLEEADSFPAEIKIGSIRFPFRGDLLRYQTGQLTLRFADYQEQDHERLLAFFTVLIGMQLAERPVTQGGLQWIHGPNYTDFFIKREDSKIHSLTCISEDSYYYWSVVGVLKTGRVQRETYAEGLSFARREKNPIVEDPFPNPLTRQLFITLLEHATLEASLKQEIITILQKT